MNDADAATLGRSLQEMGFASRSDPREADLVILITCVVRQSAEDKVIGRLSSLKGLKRRGQERAILVMGCFVHDTLRLQAQYPHVDAFFTPSDIAGVLAWVAGWIGGEPSKPSLPAMHSPKGDPVSALVPISYGCDHHCTYCIVRLRRGAQQSVPISDIMAEARTRVGRGAREVILLGQNVDAYGHDLGPNAPDLSEVLGAAHSIQDLQRIRFLTSHPGHVTQKLIATVARLPKVCPHFELPVQSGDDFTLHRMGRQYTVATYHALVDSIRAQIRDCSIATDVIVGFPGEEEVHFQRTYSLLDTLRFDAVHIAKYSPRPDTPAAKLDDDVSPDEKERRRARLEKLQTRIAAETSARLLGQTQEVLVEEQKRGRWRGRTPNNKLVFFADDSNWRGQLVNVEITWAGPWSMQGRLARWRL